jgi:hypothetical protein
MITSKYIGLRTTNGIVIIDADQYPKLKGHKVHARKSNNLFYPIIKINNKHIYLANFIKNHNPGESKGKLTVDHKNRNTWDNRDENLRIVDKTTQTINRSYNSPYDYHGVYFHKPQTKVGKGYWVVSWTENKETKYKYFPIGIDDYDTAFEKAVEYRLLIELFIPEYYQSLCLFEKSDSFSLGDVTNHPDVTIIDQTKETLGIYYCPPSGGQRARWRAIIYNNKTKKQKEKSFSVWGDEDVDNEDAKQKALKWRKQKELKYYKK